MNLPEFTFHIFIVKSVDPVANIWFEAKQADLKLFECPFSVIRAEDWFSYLQILTELSFAPLAKSVPSGDKANA
jgi:hypothetical protein